MLETEEYCTILMDQLGLETSCRWVKKKLAKKCRDPLCQKLQNRDFRPAKPIGERAADEILIGNAEERARNRSYRKGTAVDKNR